MFKSIVIFFAAVAVAAAKPSVLGAPVAFAAPGPYSWAGGLPFAAAPAALPLAAAPAPLAYSAGLPFAAAPAPLAYSAGLPFAAASAPLAVAPGLPLAAAPAPVAFAAPGIVTARSAQYQARNFNALAAPVVAAAPAIAAPLRYNSAVSYSNHYNLPVAAFAAPVLG